MTIDAAHPTAVSRDEWQTRRDQLMTAEKELTQLGDKVAAARRELPMTPVEDYTFDGPDGPVTLLDLFGDRSQLIVHNFMFHPDWDAGCPSCSNLADNVPHLSHFGPYDVAFARISRAPIDKITAYTTRMGWSAPWVSAFGNSYHQDWGWTQPDDTETPGVSFYLRVDDRPYLTYATSGRGVEPFSAMAGYLDRTIYGRQETWEVSPDGWPQDEPYRRNRRHDEYRP